MDRDLAFAMLASLATRAPTLIALTVGIILAIVRWGSHPQVARLALIGFSVLLAATLVVTPLTPLIPYWAARSGKRAVEIAPMMAVLAIAVDLLHACCLGLLIGAIFGWRGVRAPRPPERIVAN